jgi:diguanylate cyclase (GGDEF)-like protein/PAS domain S-box-containing protein
VSDQLPDAAGVGLPEQLRLAVAAARSAYQDSSRLIRLLSILGRPGSPEELVEETLTALSSVFQADVTCLVRLVDGRMVTTASCGLPEGDPAFRNGWPLSARACAVLRDGRPGTWSMTEPAFGLEDRALVDRLGLGSVAWLPLTEDGADVEHLLVLFRRESQPFTGAETALLGSVASRLTTAVQARRRAVALELLARSGHVLPRHRRTADLLRDAVELLRELLAAQHATAFLITDGRARSIGFAATGAAPASGPPWDLGELEASALPGWRSALDGRPHLLGTDRPGNRPVVVVPTGPAGAPTAVLYAGWADLPPLMLPVTDTAAIFANTLTAAMSNVSLYRALSQSEESLRLIADSIGDLIAVVDPACCFTYASAAYRRTVGHAPEALVGRSLLDLVHADHRVPVRDALMTSITTSASATIEYPLRTGSGALVWVESVLRPAGTRDRGMVMSSRLIDERKRREEELRHRAAHDPLTGLANRASATSRLQEALGSDRDGDVGVLFCDLNKFKQVNDRLGHAAGDDLLRQVAERLRRCIRAGDLIARLGGDEFVFVLDGVGSPHEVAEVGRRVAQELRAPFSLSGEQVEISISIGAAVGTRGATTPDELLDVADTAMYTDKRRGVGLEPSRITRVGGRAHRPG